jgi:hypothetical protein
MLSTCLRINVLALGYGEQMLHHQGVLVSKEEIFPCLAMSF